MTHLRHMIYLASLLAVSFWWISPAPAQEPVSVDDKIEKAISVSAITLEFIAVDMVGNGGVDWPSFNTIGEPLTRFEYRASSGAIEYWTTRGDGSFPGSYSNGSSFYFPGTEIGEAVLIEVTSDRFPAGVTSVITYNVTGLGTLSGDKLIGSTDPPYWNTIPVEGSWITSGEANAGYSGLTITPVFCDFYTTPSIAVPPRSNAAMIAMRDGEATLRGSSRETGATWSGTFPADNSTRVTSYNLYWGPSGSSTSRDVYLGTILPSGIIDFDLELNWLSTYPFRAGSISIPIPDDTGVFVDLPMAGGPNSVKLLRGIETGRYDELLAVPAPNLLLYAATKSLEEQAILASHLFPLCDADGNGRIDKGDIALLAARIPTGMVIY
ncbi:hypothetical protein GC173_04455 [bacterium]|nr:hypothetical protein [bacterium]